MLAALALFDSAATEPYVMHIELTIVTSAGGLAYGI